MIDLPKSFPMYCNDLKQIFDEIEYKRGEVIMQKDWVSLKDLPSYPKETDKHNALSDAKWNKALYYFLRNFSNFN